MAQESIAVIDQWIGRSAPTLEWVRQLSAPGFEGEVRLRNHNGIVEDGPGKFSRIPSGWYIEVFRGESWERESGPYFGDLMGPSQDAIEAAAKRAGLV